MQETKIGMAGLAPSVKVGLTEKVKYEKMWDIPGYRHVSPGEQIAYEFIRQAKPAIGEEVVDFGCGTGRGGLMLNALAGMKPIFMDIAYNALDADIRKAHQTNPEKWPFVCHDMSKWPFPKAVRNVKYGYCVDVMEHVPTEQVGQVLKNILRSARHVFFSIATVDDHFGDHIGEHLHLTVKPYEWWLEQFNNLHCSIHFSGKASGQDGTAIVAEGRAMFYVTAFATGADLQAVMNVNVDEQTIYDNVLANLRLKLNEVCPHDTQDTEIMVLGGGPSLNDFKDEIRAKRADGMYLITTNGAYNWCLDNDIKPSAQVMVDGREFNKRFVQPAIPNCKYLLSSQCHPSVAASLPHDQVLLWHAGAAPKVREAVEAFAKESGADREWYPIYGGSTVMLRAIPLLRTLGFWKLHVYGFDSCLSGAEHHAYPQKENDDMRLVEIEVGGRKFQCTAWMWEQAHEFLDLTRAIAEVCDLSVYGDGLIAHIIKTAAALPPLGEAKSYRFLYSTEDSQNGSISIPALQRSEEVSPDCGHRPERGAAEGAASQVNV